MSYLLDEKAIEKIEADLFSLRTRHSELTLKILKISEYLKHEKAKEYLFHGVLRRLNTIERCVENIYSIFPPRRKNLLDANELKDIDINLHAFFINIYGILDNMAWVVVHEKDMAESIKKEHVGLYYKKTQKCLDDNFKKYLNSDKISTWYKKYLKEFRDPISHRIPLYVPPKFWEQGDKEEEEEMEREVQKSIKKHDFDTAETLQKK